MKKSIILLLLIPYSTIYSSRVEERAALRSAAHYGTAKEDIESNAQSKDNDQIAAHILAQHACHNLSQAKMKKFLERQQREKPHQYLKVASTCKEKIKQHSTRKKHVQTHLKQSDSQEKEDAKNTSISDELQQEGEILMKDFLVNAQSEEIDESKYCTKKVGVVLGIVITAAVVAFGNLKNICNRMN